MTDREPLRPDPRPISQILVALDASPHCAAAMNAAVQLAAQLGAELRGVYVEDVNLLRMAQLQVTVEVGRITGWIRRLDHQRITYALRSQAGRARRALERAAQRLGVKASFEVLRGNIDRELLAASASADLVILGWVGWSEKRVLGSTAEAVLSAAPARTLLLDARHRLYPRLLAVYDGSSMSQRALDTALQLSRETRRQLTVAIAARDGDQARVLQSEAAARARHPEFEVSFRWLLDSDSRSLAEMIRSMETVVLVVPAESPLLEGKRLREAIEEFDRPVLVVR